ncbi:MAG: cytochrome P450 [Actinomycetota bacterium]|nr:cytochrome P450 [Actinomycetota bacterium]
MSYDEPVDQSNVLSDMFAQGFADEPIPGYQRLHRQCPVVRTEGIFGLPGVTITKYEDVLWALKHPEVFSSEDVINIGNEFPLIPLSVDPPEHAQYRRVLDPQFSPKKMAELEPEMRKLANESIDAFIAAGACDFHEDYATPLPSTFFIALMGLPMDDLPMFLKFRDDSIRPDAPTEAAQTAIREEAGHAITRWFEAAIEERRAHPDDRLLSMLVHGEVGGRPFTQPELLGACHLLLLGGLDTVTATLDCMVTYLARHPDRRRALCADFELVPPVVEELLRHQTPVMMVPRKIIKDIELGGVQCVAGDTATLIIGAANVDADEFDAADEVHFDRATNRHLAFGGGPHRCLGSHLARLELRVAIEEFHKRIPEYDIKDGAEIHFSPGIRQAYELPLVFPPGGTA